MNFKVEKRVGVRATSERIWDVIADFPGWNAWNPVETDVSGTLAFGGSIALSEAVPGLPPRQYTGRIGDWQPNGRLVWMERRGLLFNVLRYYEIEQLEPGSCILSNGFIFSGFRGEGFYEKHRRTLRAACETISEGLRVTAES
ncbi:SRPBCC domain-containing protein [Brevundimonas sp. AJA228-03]|uniref:SRPBCC domain-containing protein n=1 Tax=Brevundimonas sp. AJA228-03 TaxID=2752515 RepID=UPI001ADF6E8E|nr:SRPBCC domain-containing protein [Brevundimonas sp. AJA228-03]QTN19690.1 SRPBCC domain-containing protein [Brevundimonas sp. AJA228-03]